jgi:hypothetical protein
MGDEAGEIRSQHRDGPVNWRPLLVKTEACKRSQKKKPGAPLRVELELL